MSAQKKIVATRGVYRLVHQLRDAKAWPNTSDVVLERLDYDAMGEARWVYVYGWCLSACSDYDLTQQASSNAAAAALKMLLDEGPITKVTR